MSRAMSLYRYIGQSWTQRLVAIRLDNERPSWPSMPPRRVQAIIWSTIRDYNILLLVVQLAAICNGLPSAKSPSNASRSCLEHAESLVGTPIHMRSTSVVLQYVRMVAFELEFASSGPLAYIELQVIPGTVPKRCIPRIAGFLDLEDA
ncbi:hypothetical protein BCR37DRAFT_41198 [Protomyces lactucae-debilis]|uniref:Uncharacterized protein n=1 Tax=Protomyces lactucae-debilis TaxID=2754530 RepID=A0A1Y2FBP6_PROLT|nr:uncharacterized protein BCR37DRAFT_41198 [Protomyces lactucae-debilis]ORY81340.1 hypothetical protein BCR37DRAFT_41198 [Protomyces lactucae-debilis]